MNILISGGTGFIGQHLCQFLEAQGHHVITVSRRTGHDFRQLTTATAWYPLLKEVDVVINAAGIISETSTQNFEVIHLHAPKALFQACVEKGVDKVIQISSIATEVPGSTPYQVTKKAADEFLLGLDIPAAVVRPSVVYGKGGTSFKFFHMSARFPVIPVVGDGRQLLQPVYIDDVVEVVHKCLQASAPSEINLVGPDIVEYREWLQHIRHALGKPSALILPTPFCFMKLTAKMAQRWLPLLSLDNLSMLQHAMTFDVQPFQDFLRRQPTTVEEGLCLTLR